MTNSNYPMLEYSIEEVIQSTDRNKICVLTCDHLGQLDCIAWLKTNKIHAVDLGKELAKFIDGINDFSYLNMEVFDNILKLLDLNKSKINNTDNDIVAIYNFGILLEPSLELNATKLLKDFSRTTTLILIWENLYESTDKLRWSTQQDTYFFNFTEIPLKKLRYAI